MKEYLSSIKEAGRNYLTKGVEIARSTSENLSRSIDYILNMSTSKKIKAGLSAAIFASQVASVNLNKDGNYTRAGLGPAGGCLFLLNEGGQWALLGDHDATIGEPPVLTSNSPLPEAFLLNGNSDLRVSISVSDTDGDFDRFVLEEELLSGQGPVGAFVAYLGTNQPVESHDLSVGEYDLVIPGRPEREARVSIYGVDLNNNRSEEPLEVRLVNGAVPPALPDTDGQDGDTNGDGGNGDGISNRAPVADPQSVQVDEDRSLDIFLTGTDPDNDPLTPRIIRNPNSGNLIIEGRGIVRYEPNSNYNGPDSFDFVENDGIVDSEVARVNIDVNPVNDSPVARPQIIHGTEDTLAPGLFTGSDVDNSNLEFRVLSGPSDGTLTQVDDQFTYNPNQDFNGHDSFAFIAVDPEGAESEPQTVEMDIAAVNDRPIARDVNLTVARGGSSTVRLNGSDVDRDTLIYQLTTPPRSGGMIINRDEVTYEPFEGFTGDDEAFYRVSDGQGWSELARIIIEVTNQ
ncbi:MAG: cadherin-like domain-containing protein [Nanoarchaeota archaeon]